MYGNIQCVHLKSIALPDKLHDFPGVHLYRQVEIAAENLTKTVDKLNNLRYIASHNTDQA